MKFCMECGTELPERAKFCSNCGLPLTDQLPARWDDEPAAAPPPVAAPMPPPAAAPIAEPSPSPWVAPPADPPHVPELPPPPRYDPPVPVAPHAFRQPYTAPLDSTTELPTYTSPLPWETEERDDLVPPPASAYVDELPDDDIPLPPPPPPRYETYVVEEPAPPFADGYDVPNLPPDPLTLVPTPDGPKKKENWFTQHKLLTATALVLAAVIIAAAVNSNNDTPTATVTPSPSFPPGASVGIGTLPSPSVPPAASVGAGGGNNRREQNGSDQVRPLGSAASIGGVEATVRAAGFQQVVGDGADGYVVADVAYVNRSGATKPYTSLDWKLETPNGTLTDLEFAGSDGQLGSGELAADGTVSGQITFKVGTAKGDFRILWKPEALGASRGVWTVTVA